MEVYEIIIGVVLLLLSIATIGIVLMQESRSAGLSGAIAGGADTFLGKNKGKSVDEKLVKITKVFTTVFFILTLICALIVLINQ